MPVERALGTPYVYSSMPVTIAIGNAIGYDRNVFFFMPMKKATGMPMTNGMGTPMTYDFRAHGSSHGHAHD